MAPGLDAHGGADGLFEPGYIAGVGAHYAAEINRMFLPEAEQQAALAG